jgi:hypothetical protein
VTSVTTRTVALSSTVSLVNKSMLWLMSTDVAWFLRLRVTESYSGSHYYRSVLGNGQLGDIPI